MGGQLCCYCPVCEHRAFDTAKSIYDAVMKACPQHNVLLEKDARLRERNLGDAQGRTMTELKGAGQHETMEAVRVGSKVPGDGESLEDVSCVALSFFFSRGRGTGGDICVQRE